MKFNKVMPSLEHFQMRHESPRVYFLFYNYFLRAVMGESKWTSSLNENKKLGTTVAEAYAHTLLENNYFAWLFEYKEKQREGDKIKTEYDTPGQEGDENNNIYMPRELADIEIRVAEGLEDGFQLVKAEDDADIHKELQGERMIAQFNVGETARDSSYGHVKTNDKVNEKVEEFERSAGQLDEKGIAKKRRNMMRDLKTFTGKSGSMNHNKFLFDMSADIKKDDQTGKRGMFQKAYRKLLEAMDASVNKENIADDKYEMDCAAFYVAEEE